MQLIKNQIIRKARSDCKIFGIKSHSSLQVYLLQGPRHEDQSKRQNILGKERVTR